MFRRVWLQITLDTLVFFQDRFWLDLSVHSLLIEFLLLKVFKLSYFHFENLLLFIFLRFHIRFGSYSLHFGFRDLIEFLEFLDLRRVEARTVLVRPESSQVVLFILVWRL
mmetsp:Transcript_12545/g.12340  ORF Transcript_12545/g.12340 Transcript_12545/m.12340 type:complete len:110 (+) Transcript_12545:1329-1658(+)